MKKKFRIFFQENSLEVYTTRFCVRFSLGESEYDFFSYLFCWFVICDFSEIVLHCIYNKNHKKNVRLK